MRKTILEKSSIYLALIMLACLAACKEPVSEALLSYPDQALLSSPVWPLRLDEGLGTLHLADYFGTDFEPDSVTYPRGVLGRIADGMIGLSMIANAKSVDRIHVWKGGFAYTIPVFRSDKIEYSLTLDTAFAREGPVQAAGAFNDWNPLATFMTREGAKWSTTLRLDPGQYPYQMVVNGQWMLDPGNPDSLDNNIGGYNSLLRVKRPTGLPFLRPFDIQSEELVLEIKGQISGFILLWEYAELDEQFWRLEDQRLYIKVPAQARDRKKSELFVCAWNEQGRSNDLRIPLLEGLPVGTQVIPERVQRQAMTMYFPLIDRFANGDPSNDRPSEDPRVLPPANFFGGDLQGLTQHLDYLENLGINTIWISPVALNPTGVYQEYPEPRRWFSAYHGYWPVSYHKVDPRFGGDAALDELVSQAHKRGMRVLLDFVANHVHQEHPMIIENPGWATTLDLDDGTRNLRRWDEHRLTTWFDDFLPSLDFENPLITEAVTDSALFWIERFNLDGFRHDATKHIPELFWRTLTTKLRTNFPERDLFQIGESFGSRELIASYMGPGMLDSQFDFPLYFAARSCLINTNSDFSDLADELLASLESFGHHHLMGNITGNHDMARFSSLAGAALLPGEDDKEVGWEREIGVGDPIAYPRMALLMAFQSAIPGLPVVYYGDEIGMPGAGDPDSRRMMRFSDWSAAETALHARFTELLQRRKSDPALQYGSTELLYADQHVLVIRRDWFGHKTFALLNKGAESANVDLPELGTVTIPAYNALFR